MEGQPREAEEQSETVKPPRFPYGGKYCCAVGCSNSTYRDVPRGIKFHVFPRDPERRMQWILAVKRTVPGKPGSLWQPKDSAVLCSEHFVNGKKSNDTNSPSYVPSIFPTHTLRANTASDLARTARRREREARGPASSCARESEAKKNRMSLAGTVGKNIKLVIQVQFNFFYDAWIV